MTHVTQTTTLSSASTIIICIVDTKLHLGIVFSQFRVGHVDSVFAVIVIVSRLIVVLFVVSVGWLDNVNEKCPFNLGIQDS